MRPINQLVDLCAILESCRNKADLSAALNIPSHQLAGDMFFKMAINKFDVLFADYQSCHDVSMHRKTIVTERESSTVFDGEPFFFDDIVIVDRDVEKHYTTDVLLRDELYLRALNAINLLYQLELRHDRQVHPSGLFGKSKSQEYEHRNDKILNSQILFDMIRKTRGVVMNTEHSDIVPADLFQALCGRQTVLSAIADRVFMVFSKKSAGQFSIADLWEQQLGYSYVSQSRYCA